MASTGTSSGMKVCNLLEDNRSLDCQATFNATTTSIPYCLARSRRRPGSSLQPRHNSRSAAFLC